MQGQHLMQMNQGLMGGYGTPTTVTTDLIQQYLDENKQLILAILDNQNSGKVEECARNQAKLQHNLMYLAAIADSQPPQASMAQYPSNVMMQSGGRYVQTATQPGQQMIGQQQQQLMSARTPLMYAQPAATHLSVMPGPAGGGTGVTGGSFSLLHSDGSGVGPAHNMFSDFGRSKQELGVGSSISTEVKSGDGSESMYLKGNEEDGN